MKKQLIIVWIIALLVSVGLSGCNDVSGELNKFVGRINKIDVRSWEGANESMYYFFPEGTYWYRSGKLITTMCLGKYKVIDGKIFLTTSHDNVTHIWKYLFSENNTLLTFSSLDDQDVCLNYHAIDYIIIES